MMFWAHHADNEISPIEHSSNNIEGEFERMICRTDVSRELYTLGVMFLNFEICSSKTIHFNTDFSVLAENGHRGR